MKFTKRIAIERYPSTSDSYAGLIEGESEDGQRWVMWLDAEGRPEIFWPERGRNGAVIGEGIPLTSEGRKHQAARRMAKMREILDCDPDPAFVVKRLRDSLEAVEKYHRGEDIQHNIAVEQAIMALDARNTPSQNKGKPSGG